MAYQNSMSQNTVAPLLNQPQAPAPAAVPKQMFNPSKNLGVYHHAPKKMAKPMNAVRMPSARVGAPNVKAMAKSSVGAGAGVYGLMGGRK